MNRRRGAGIPETGVQPGTVPLQRPEPIICVDNIAYVLFERPDLDLAERFLGDFGLVRVQRTVDSLHLRGAGTAPYCYAVRRSPEARFVGFGLRAASDTDLERLAKVTGAELHQVDDPGGGRRITLRDPAGFRVDVVHGAEEAPSLPQRSEPLPVNTPQHKVRTNQPQRPPERPSQIVRLGHLVLQVVDFDACAQWYMRHFGLIPSDVQCLADGSPALAFLRCDRGERPADHHSLVLFGGIENRYGHSAYEVVDLDDVGMGHNVLRQAEWKHVWGIGRHLLGSQIFDYWQDPWGDEHEHYADGDVFDASYPTAYHRLERSSLWMWGQDLPAHFGARITPTLLASVIGRLATGRLSLTRLRLLRQIESTPARPWLR